VDEECERTAERFSHDGLPTIEQMFIKSLVMEVKTMDLQAILTFENGADFSICFLGIHGFANALRLPFQQERYES
jgi:hypothetical protein